MYLSRQDTDFLNDLSRFTELRPHLQIEEPRQEEMVPKVINELPDLLRMHGDQALVTALLPIFLLEKDARHAPLFPLFGRYDLPRLSSGDSDYSLVVLGIRPRQAFQII